MKNKSLIFAITFSICLGLGSGASARNGVNVSISQGRYVVDDINGLDHKVGLASTYYYTVMMESEVNIQEYSLGFILYSPDGSLSNIIWDNIPRTIARTRFWPQWNVSGPLLGAGIDEFDGSLPSNWISGGVASGAQRTGFGPIGLKTIMDFTITFPGIEGGILCIDSASFPPASSWLMAPIDSSEIVAHWGGGGGDIDVGGSRANAFCVTASALPEEISPVFTNCPEDFSTNHCDPVHYQAQAHDPNSENQLITYTVLQYGNGTAHVDSVGNVTYSPWGYDISDVTITVTATEVDGASSECVTILSVTNNSPHLVCPPDVEVIRGSLRTSPPANGGDADECDALVYSLISVNPLPAGSISVDPVTGAITFDSDKSDSPSGVDTDYDVCISVTDGFDEVTCCMVFTVLGTEEFCVRIDQTDKSDSAGFSAQGHQAEVCINYDAGSERVGGFDFLISYDPSALSFIGATEGNIFADYEWEYFTYRFGPNGNCTGGCPSGKLRVVGLAEQNDGMHHPNNTQLVVGDQFVCLTFLISNDRNLSCKFTPIRWVWVGCFDNSLSSTFGDTLFTSRNVYDYVGSDSGNVHNEYRAELTGFNQVFPTNTGAPNECDVEPERGSPIRFIDFKNGGVKIACPGQSNNTGDVNVNGIANEIADAFMLMEYFVNGLAAFGPHIETSIAASEINCDGIPLTVADFVYLQRIIDGDALTLNCNSGGGVGASSDASGKVIFSINGDVVSSNRELGAALFVFDGPVSVELLADNLNIKTGIVDGNTHAFVYSSFHSNQVIESGPVLSSGGALLSVEAGDVYGALLDVEFDFITDVDSDEESLLPTRFALYQNYPNPFNPSTTIKMDFPRVSNYELTIYNVRGQKVDQQTGSHSAGTLNYIWDPQNLPSGVYFYKIKAGDFVSTKKLVFLK